MAFGHGFHVCLGNALARVEGRVALDEILNRFPEWEVDLDNAWVSPTSTVRGWETLPTYVDGTVPVRTRGKTRIGAPPSDDPAPAPEAGAEAWTIVLETAMGPQTMSAHLKVDGGVLSGLIQSDMGSEPVSGAADGDRLEWTMQVTKPMALELRFDVTVAGGAMAGEVELGAFGKAKLSGVRA